MSRLAWHAAQWQRVDRARAEGRMPHAILLAGAPGLGQFGFAVRLCQELHCQQDGSACGTCDGCRHFVAGTHADHGHMTREINPDTGKLRQVIRVEQVREARDQLWLTAQRGGWRTLIIEPADRLGHEAANALLKTLEEPPPDTLIVLVSSRPGRVPATLRSRCQRLDFTAPDPAQGEAWLASQAPRADWPVWLGVAGGAPLAALALVEGGFAARRADCAAALQAVAEGRAEPVSVAGEWAKEGDPGTLVEWWATVVMDLITLASAGQGARLRNADLGAGLQSMGQRLHLRPLHAFLGILFRARRLLETSVNPQLLFEALLVAWSQGLEQDALNPLLQDD